MTQTAGWQRGLSEPLEDTVMVSLDLETTGLDARADRILEIGAVKFRGEAELDRFSALVNPGVAIPPFVAELTGIRQDDVAGAPPIDAVIPPLTAFLGDYPMIGHNVGFDARFLVRNGVPPRQQTFDTYDLAYVLLPGAAEYGLGGLAAAYGLTHDDPHRALSDALVTRDLFIEMLSRLRALSPALLAELSRLTALSGWTTGVLAGRILDHLEPGAGGSLPAGVPAALDRRELGRRLRTQGRPETPGEAPDLPDAQLPPGLAAPAVPELAAGTVAEVFARDGHLSRNLGDYEHRPQQAQMADAVADAIENGGHLIVEAGTGVGKSLAYLVPAALHALGGGGTVIVSTNTINLQEQLVAKDIPAAEAVLTALGFPDGALSSAHLKGRANYLCYRRWDLARSATEMSVEEARLMAKTLCWLESSATGDRAELRLNRDDQRAFTKLSAQGARGCPAPEGPCFLRAARARAHDAQIVAINHSLLMADLVLGGGLLPEHDALIIDEAHHLESVATTNLGFRVDQRQVEGDLASLAGARGLVEEALRTLRAAGEADPDIESLAANTQEMVGLAREASGALFRALRGAVEEFTPGRGLSGNDLRVTAGTRAQPAWSDLEIGWENFDLRVSALTTGLRDIGAALDRASRPGAAVPAAAVALNVSAALEALQLTRAGLRQGLAEPDDGMVYWLSARQPEGPVAVAGAPLSVGPSLRDALFARERCVVLTSGTLTYDRRFDRLRDTLGVGESQEVALGSPFDFKKAALALVPGNVPEPNRPGFNDAVAQAIRDVATSLRDRVLVLFTSYSALNAARSAITAPLRAEGIRVVAQGMDGPPHRVMRALDAEQATVALGAASLWEGVDLERSSLAALVIARLPFPVPSDPVFAARSEQYDDGFGEYAVPEAVLRFRQGFGRLIRSTADRGVFVVLDSRMVSRGYGAAFRDALPGCDIEVVRAEQLGERVRQWRADTGR